MFRFKVPSIQEDSEDTTTLDYFFTPQAMQSLRKPINIVRKLVTTQRRTSLQRLSSSITNLAEVRGKASRRVHSQRYKPFNSLKFCYVNPPAIYKKSFSKYLIFESSYSSDSVNNQSNQSTAFFVSCALTKDRFGWLLVTLSRDWYPLYKLLPKERSSICMRALIPLLNIIQLPTHALGLDPSVENHL